MDQPWSETVFNKLPTSANLLCASIVPFFFVLFIFLINTSEDNILLAPII